MKKRFVPMQVAKVGKIEDVVNQTVTITKLGGRGDQIESLRQTNRPF